MLQLFFDVYNQFLALYVDGVLGIEQLAAFGVPRLLQGLDNFLGRQLVLQRLRQGRRLSGLAYLFVDLLDFPLQPLLEVLGPTIQIEDFFVEEFPVEFVYVEEYVRSGRAQLSKKMDEVKLLMFNKIYHTFLSNPVKINKKTPRLFRDNGALKNIGQGMVPLRCHSMDCTGPR
ncbi:MAG: hypothetical protein L6406_19110 [Desulfobacterales bacterium]|nr:hypothetical protein [Desulfobacterales bacterium]